MATSNFAGVAADQEDYLAMDLQIGTQQTARFVVDTGASNTLMRDSEARRLGAHFLSVPVTAQGGTGELNSGLRLANLGEETQLAEKCLVVYMCNYVCLSSCLDCFYELVKPSEGTIANEGKGWKGIRWVKNEEHQDKTVWCFAKRPVTVGR